MLDAGVVKLPGPEVASAFRTVFPRAAGHRATALRLGGPRQHLLRKSTDLSCHKARAHCRRGQATTTRFRWLSEHIHMRGNIARPTFSNTNRTTTTIKPIRTRRMSSVDDSSITAAIASISTRRATARALYIHQGATMADHLERRTKPRDTDRLNAARERLDVVLADARRLRADEDSR